MAADWYVSSVAYAAVTPFAASHAYSLGDIIRQRGTNTTLSITTLTSVTTTATAVTASAHGFITGQSVLISGATQTNYNKQTTITVTNSTTFTYTITATTSPATGSPVVLDFVAAGNERCWRCSTAGTSAASEPAWTLTKASTTTSNTAIFTECSGNSSHQHDNGVTTSWTAPLARVLTGYSGSFAGSADRVFVSSDHTENYTTSASFTNVAGSGANQIRCYSVSKSGSVPPVAADLAAGATLGVSGSVVNLTVSNGYWEGFTLIVGSDAGNYSTTMTLAFASGTAGDVYLKNCAVQVSTTGSGILNCASTSVNRCVFDNTTAQFGSTACVMQAASSGYFEWRNTPSAIQGATIPTTLFSPNTAIGIIECRGVDFSALGSGKTLLSISNSGTYEARFSDCKIGASAALTSGVVNETPSRIDFINVDSGATGYVNQWVRYDGTITTDTTLIRTGGASDGTTTISHKYASTAFTSKPFPLEGPPLFAWNSTTGSSVTLTVEFLAATALNNDDIWIEVEYLGSSGAPLSSVVNDTVATSLTTAGTQSASTKTFANWSADCFDPNNTTVTTLSASNRTATKNAASSGGATTLCYFGSGKVYWEVTIGSVPASIYLLGLANAAYNTNTSLASTTNSLGYAPSTGVVKINNSTLATIQTAGNGDVVGFAVDLTNSKVWIRKNSGNWNNAAIGSQDPASNVGGISLSTLAAGPYNAAFFDSANSSVATFNGGSSAFTAAAPSGFSAINTGVTQNLGVSFNAQMQGLVRAIVKLANPSTTVYVDPVLLGVT